MPANDLLHAVRLCDVNEGARQQLKELMCEVLREQGVGQTPVVLGPEGVRALYLDGASRTAFYDLLQSDPHLKSLRFKLGDRSLWLVADLDQWIVDYKARQQAKPKLSQAA